MLFISFSGGSFSNVSRAFVSQCNRSWTTTDDTFVNRQMSERSLCLSTRQQTAHIHSRYLKWTIHSVHMKTRRRVWREVQESAPSSVSICFQNLRALTHSRMCSTFISTHPKNWVNVIAHSALRYHCLRSVLNLFATKVIINIILLNKRRKVKNNLIGWNLPPLLHIDSANNLDCL